MNPPGLTHQTLPAAEPEGNGVLPESVGRGSAAAIGPNDLNRRLPEVVEALVGSVMNEPETQGMQHLNRVLLPSRDAIIDCIELLRQLTFPGYFGKQGLTSQNVTYRIGELVIELSNTLYEQVRCCLRYRRQIPGPEDRGERCQECDSGAARVVAEFLDQIPAVRRMLAADVQAAFDGDPAAQSPDETIFCYPGLFAIFVQRMAHEFYQRRVPLLPRIMTEYAHSLTGIDIHPGAKLGRSFFIDHGTGVVIGETTEIGDNVKVYQGVTLGAVAPQYGQALRGEKRHPTIEDDVTIYAGATILGGKTRIGRRCVIGGNVFITDSVPAFTRVTAEQPKLTLKQRKAKGRDGDDPGGGNDEFLLDFQI